MTEELSTNGYDPISHYYDRKPEFDYAKFVELVKDETKEYTRETILEDLRIPGEVLDAFVDKALTECKGEERDQICKRVMQINKPEWESIIKRLKFANLDFKQKFTTLEERYLEAEKNLSILADEKVKLSLSLENLEEIKETNARLVEETEAKNEKITKLNNEMQELKNEISLKNGELKGLELTVETNTSLSGEIKSYQDKTSALEVDLDNKKEEIKKLTDKIVLLEETISQLENEPLYEEEQNKNGNLKSRIIPFSVAGVIILVLVGLIVYFLGGSKKDVNTPLKVSQVVAETKPTNPQNMAVPPIIAQQNLTSAPAAAQVNAPTSIISHLVTPEAFRSNTKSFRVVDQSLIIENETFLIGAIINGFKIISIEKTNVRLLDLNSNLQFRVDIGVSQ